MAAPSAWNPKTVPWVGPWPSQCHRTVTFPGRRVSSSMRGATQQRAPTTRPAASQPHRRVEGRRASPSPRPRRTSPTAAGANSRCAWAAIEPAPTSTGHHPSRPEATVIVSTMAVMNQTTPTEMFQAGSTTTKAWVAATTARTITTAPAAIAPRKAQAASTASATPIRQRRAEPQRTPWTGSARTGRARSQKRSGPGS